jgi:acylphosphatase
MLMIRNYRIVVRGNVQGVGFRFHTRREAARTGVKGWVRNQSDGSVLISAEGEEHNLDLFVSWCHKGPESARVHVVDVSEDKVMEYQSFDVKF